MTPKSLPVALQQCLFSASGWESEIRFSALPTPAPHWRDTLYWEAAFLFWWYIVDWLCTRFNRAIILLSSGCDKLAALGHGPESGSRARNLSSSLMEERKNRFSVPYPHFHLGSTINESSFPKQRYQFTNWRTLNDTERGVCLFRNRKGVGFYGDRFNVRHFVSFSFAKYTHVHMANCNENFENI